MDHTHTLTRTASLFIHRNYYNIKKNKEIGIKCRSAVLFLLMVHDHNHFIDMKKKDDDFLLVLFLVFKGHVAYLFCSSFLLFFFPYYTLFMKLPF